MDFTGPVHARMRFRFKLPRPVFYTVEDTTAEGVLCDISTGGAMIETKDDRLKAGERTILRFQLFDDSEQIEVEMEVVRETEVGFAGRFHSVPSQLVFQLSRDVARSVKTRFRGREEKGSS